MDCSACVWGGSREPPVDAALFHKWERTVKVLPLAWQTRSLGESHTPP